MIRYELGEDGELREFMPGDPGYETATFELPEQPEEREDNAE